MSELSTSHAAAVEAIADYRRQDMTAWINRRMGAAGFVMAAATVGFIGAHSLLDLPPLTALFGFIPAALYALGANPWVLRWLYRRRHPISVWLEGWAEPLRSDTDVRRAIAVAEDGV